MVKWKGSANITKLHQMGFNVSTTAVIFCLRSLHDENWWSPLKSDTFCILPTTLSVLHVRAFELGAGEMKWGLIIHVPCCCHPCGDQQDWMVVFLHCKQCPDSLLVSLYTEMSFHYTDIPLWEVFSMVLHLTIKKEIQNIVSMWKVCKLKLIQVIYSHVPVTFVRMYCILLYKNIIHSCSSPMEVFLGWAPSPQPSGNPSLAPHMYMYFPLQIMASKTCHPLRISSDLLSGGNGFFLEQHITCRLNAIQYYSRSVLGFCRIKKGT